MNNFFDRVNDAMDKMEKLVCEIEKEKKELLKKLFVLPIPYLSYTTEEPSFFDGFYNDLFMIVSVTPVVSLSADSI